MDKKALFRAKLNAKEKEKRIDSPLVRYNEFEQPVCRVCDVVFKSNLWDAHQVSRKHKEAISNLKATAAGLTQHNKAKPTDAKLPKAKPEQPLESQSKMRELSQEKPKPQSSSVLPSDFFDDSNARKTRPGHKLEEGESNFHGNGAAQSKASLAATEIRKTSSKPTDTKFPKAKPEEPLESQSKMPELSQEKPKPQSSSVLPSDFFDDSNSKKTKPGVKLGEEESNFHGNGPVQSKVSQAATEIRKTSSKNSDTEVKQVKGLLPEGFFDNKEADLRARGIKLVKPDVKDEYKEFEKLIQEDLKEVDDRMEEEEIDAAEMIEEAESVEQKSFRERVEMLKKRRLEQKAAKSEKRSKSSEAVSKESRQEESSSDDESGENFAVDWRAQHL